MNLELHAVLLAQSIVLFVLASELPMRRQFPLLGGSDGITGCSGQLR